jgi:protein TonB
MVQKAPAPPSVAPPAIAPRGPAVASGPPGPPQIVLPSSDYLHRLVAYLNGYKNYPHDARQRREQGVVRLHFVMDRSGRVLSYDIAGSSGSAALDEAARDLIRRAQPLPPVPADYPGDRLDLIVPVVFSLH